MLEILGCIFVLQPYNNVYIKYSDIRYLEDSQSKVETKSVKRQTTMRGAVILIVFFSLFTAASLLIPSPMFPGNVLCTLIGGVASEYIVYVSALFNGILYGVTLWLVFIAVSRRIAQEK